MKVNYLVTIENPQNHILKVQMSAPRCQKDKVQIFLPSWSPGSYLMREYTKNIRTFKALSSNGEYLNFSQIKKGIWEIDFKASELKKECSDFTVQYEVYCHELTVRTSHIDESHAFLHGPSYLMGIKDEQMSPEIEFKFPALWSKLHSGLTGISKKREQFIYSAKTYDDLIDCPVEIGCHESDGFMFDGKEHHLIWYGEEYPHQNNLKEDIIKIVETVAAHFSSVPYDHYTIMTHFKRNLYGGLEHKNSTALQFDGRKLSNRKDYINWLALVAHEYFHTWNVKRIRPIELGPFDYTKENYTSMHWLTEGLTSFMDELFVLRSKLCTLTEYLDMQKANIERYLSIPGKKFHSLEQSSFNAWVKLYRPDENSNNSSISYYLKGGLVFSTLHFDFKKAGKDINDLLSLLWKRYLDNPEVGMTTKEVMSMIEEVGGKEIKERFELRISTTEDIDFESYYEEIGLKFIWEQKEGAYLGADFTFEGDRVVIGKVLLDGPAHKSGLNAGDEIIGLNNIRFLKEDVKSLKNFLPMDQTSLFTISRLGVIKQVEVLATRVPKSLKMIDIVDEKKALTAFGCH